MDLAQDELRQEPAQRGPQSFVQTLMLGLGVRRLGLEYVVY